MRTSKVDRYIQKLIELRKIRSEGNDREAEKNILEVMEVLWESMTLEERSHFKNINTLSWPPPPDTEKEENI